MTREQFHDLSINLRKVAPLIPLNWGHVQNDLYDRQLREICNIFEIMSLTELEESIVRFDSDHKNYYRRRWYLIRCADCDEYLFYKNNNVIRNPNRFDKKWDIKINEHFLFDIKGTVIPRDYRENIYEVINNPKQIIQFYYDKQSRGVRYDMQNRLFIIHHSLVDHRRELLLRCAWKTKEWIYRQFVEYIDYIHFYQYLENTVAVIFIIETEPKILRCKICGLDESL